jgi:uncharacterized membrane protein YgcG
MQLTKILIPLTLGALLVSTPVFAADWHPTFAPGQAVYVDPALVSSKTAPVKFGAELEQQIKALHDKSNLDLIVVAVEATNAPTDKPLGVAKADELIAYLGSQQGFPENYALIAWARRAEDPSKGGVGINLSSDQIKFDVKPFLKGRMPQNPKGAILAIADHISENKIAQVNEVKAEKAIASFLNGLGAIFLTILGWLAAGVAVWALIKALKPNFLYKKEAELSVEKWSAAVSNATDIHLKLVSDDAIEFYSLLAKSLETNKQNKLRASLELAKVEISMFLCIYEKCRATGDALEKLLSNSQYKTICSMMSDVVYSVDFGKLPIKKASVFGGLNDVKEYKGIELLNALDKSMRQVLGAISKVKYDETTPEKAVANFCVEHERIEKEEAKQVENYRMHEREMIAQRARLAKDKMQRQDRKRAERAARPIVQPSSTTVIVDNSTTSYGSSHSSHRKSDDSSSSRSSDSGSSSSSSDWGSSGSDYSSSDSGSFGSDY